MGVIRDLIWSTIATPPSPATTGLTFGVATGDGSLFSTGGYPKKALIVPPGVIPSRTNAERVLITGNSGDTLTIQARDAGNYNGGTGRNIAAGWVIMNTPFADDFFNMSIVTNEVPAGLINGSNTAYTVAGIFRTGSLKVYLNGQRLTGGAGNDYTESSAGTGFTMLFAPSSGDVLLVDYEIGDTTLNVGGNSYVSDEAVTGSINGSNTSFTTVRAYISTTLEVFVNGVKQIRGTDFTETTPGSGIFTMAEAPLTGDSLRVNYQFNLNPSSNADTVDGAHASTTPVAGVVPITDSLNMLAVNIYRNFVINGACQIAQRAVPNLSTTSQYGKVDRFRVHATGTAVSAGTITQSTASPIGRTGNSLHVSGVTITGTGIIYVKHRIEAKDALDFKNQVASFMCSVYQDTGVAVNYTITIRKPTTTTDDFSAVTDIGNSGQLSVANNTASQIKLENLSMGDCSKGIEIEIKIECGAVTSKNFHLTEFQFNRGAKALSFEPKTAAEDLALCQRYYEKSYDYNTAPGTATGLSGGIEEASGDAANNTIAMVRYKVTKRVGNLATIWDTAGNVGKTTKDGVTANTTPGGLDNNVDSGFKVFQGACWRVSFHWACDAEL